jgi:hypothetical protein
MNCRPVVEAGQAQLVDDDFTLDDTVWLTPTPGHSLCDCCVNIRSRAQRAVVTGDLMHHALQCREPAWLTIFGGGRCFPLSLLDVVGRKSTAPAFRQQRRPGMSAPHLRGLTPAVALRLKRPWPP